MKLPWLQFILLGLILVAARCFAQAPDNRYCSVGNVWTGGASDGPAALPRACLNTSIPNTPSPSAVTSVTGDLFAAYSAAACGSTLVVPHGSSYTFTWSQMNVLFPSKGCDDAHWITIKSDGALPAEGTQADPAYAPQMFKILVSGNNSAVVAGDHIRFIGVEVAPNPTNPYTSELVTIEGNHVIFDRSYIHGTLGIENRKGIWIHGATYVGVVDSWLDNFKCIAITGACLDAQAISIADTTLPEGVITIKNNHLEAAAENILFGGAVSGLTIPADIEVRKNTITKPPNWNPSDASFIGPQQYIVKNLLELKNGQRILIEGNELSNCWGGFSQQGWGSVFTPRGTWAAVQDITYRYNTIRHVGGVWQIMATVASDVSKADSLALQRLSFHDNDIADVDPVHYNSNGRALEIGSTFAVNAPLNNLLIDHNTIYGNQNYFSGTTGGGSNFGLFVIGSNPLNPKLPFNITITNNVMETGPYPVGAIGGTDDCQGGTDQPLKTFNLCWSAWTFSGNTLLIQDSPVWQWPTGNNLVNAGANRWSAMRQAMQ